MNIHLRFSKHCWQYPILVTLHEKARSSRPEVFCKKGVFENFANQRCFPVNFAKFSRTAFFLEDPLWLLLKSEKPEAVSQRCSVKRLLLKISQTKGVFLWILQNFQEHLFHRAPPAATSEKPKAEAVVRRFSVKKVFSEISQNS